MVVVGFMQNAFGMQQRLASARAWAEICTPSDGESTPLEDGPSHC